MTKLLMRFSIASFTVGLLLVGTSIGFGEETKSVYASEEDARWIKDQVWLYYSTRPQ